MLAGEQLRLRSRDPAPAAGRCVGRRAECSSAAQVTAEAEIFFAHLDQNRSQQLFGDHNFVFSGEMKHATDKVRGETGDFVIWPLAAQRGQSLPSAKPQAAND